MEITANEELLLVSAAQGDQKAVRELMEREKAWLYALAFRICQNPTAAKDATVYALGNAFSEIDPSEVHKPFRIMAAKHLFIYLQKLPEKRLSADASALNQLNIAENLPREQKAMLTMFIAGLQCMTFKERAMLLFRDQGNLSYKAIAEIMGASSSAAVVKDIAAYRVKLKEMVRLPFKDREEERRGL